VGLSRGTGEPRRQAAGCSSAAVRKMRDIYRTVTTEKPAGNSRAGGTRQQTQPVHGCRLVSACQGWNAIFPAKNYRNSPVNISSYWLTFYFHFTIK